MKLNFGVAAKNTEQVVLSIHGIIVIHPLGLDENNGTFLFLVFFLHVACCN